MKQLSKTHILILGAMAALLFLMSLAFSPASVSVPAWEGYEGEGTPLEIYAFQAGKADAFLLMTENGTVLIDAGEKGFGNEILAFLNEKGIEKIDVMIITHFDQDHVGGAAKVLNNFPVGLVLQSNSPKDSTEYEKYTKALTNAQIEPVTVREDYGFTLDGVGYLVNAPRKSDYQNDDSNNSSLIVSVYNGEDSFLFMGDAQTERIREFLDAGCESYDLLKVPHHGQEESEMEKLVAAVSPSVAIITSSEEEPEDEDTVNILTEASAEVYLTRISPVMVRSDGHGINISYVSAENEAAEAESTQNMPSTEAAA